MIRFAAVTSILVAAAGACLMSVGLLAPEGGLVALIGLVGAVAGVGTLNAILRMEA